MVSKKTWKFSTVKFTLWTSEELTLPQKSSATRPQMCQGVLEQFWLEKSLGCQETYSSQTIHNYINYIILPHLWRRTCFLTCDWIAFLKASPRLHSPQNDPMSAQKYPSGFPHEQHFVELRIEE